MDRCTECGQEFAKITSTHVRTHGLSLEQYYKKQNPEQERTTDISKIRVKPIPKSNRLLLKSAEIFNKELLATNKKKNTEFLADMVFENNEIINSRR